MGKLCILWAQGFHGQHICQRVINKMTILTYITIQHEMCMECTFSSWTDPWSFHHWLVAFHGCITKNIIQEWWRKYLKLITFDIDNWNIFCHMKLAFIPTLPTLTYFYNIYYFLWLHSFEFLVFGLELHYYSMNIVIDSVVHLQSFFVLGVIWHQSYCSSRAWE